MFNSNRSEYLKRNQTELNLLKFFFKCGSYFGGTSLEYKKNKLSYYLNFTVVLGFYVYYLYISYVLTADSPTEPLVTFATIMWRLILTFLATYFVFWPHLAHNKEFEQIHTKFEELENIVRLLKFDQNTDMLKHEIKIFSLVLGWIVAYSAVIISVFLVVHPDSIGFLFFMVPNHIYATSLFMNIFITSTLLERRIRFTAKVIKKCSHCKVIGTDDFSTITKFFRINQEIIDLFNKVFGYPISLFLTASLVQLLRFTFMVIYFYNDETSVVFLSFETAIPWSMTIIVIINCDSLEKRGRSIVRMCFKIHENLKTYDMNNEFLIIGETAEKLAPKITVPLFGLINRQTFNYLFAMFVEALVILVQFKMSMQ